MVGLHGFDRDGAIIYGTVDGLPMPAMEPMSFDELSELYRVEMKSSAITQVRRDLFRAIANLLTSLRLEYDRQMALDPESVMCEGADQRRKKAERLAKDVVHIRTQKICQMAIRGAMGGRNSLEVLTDEEKAYYEQVLALSKGHMSEVDRLRGRRNTVATHIDDVPQTPRTEQPSEPPEVPEPTRKMDDVPFDDSPEDFQDEPIPDDFDGFGDEPFDGEPPVAEPAPTVPEPAPTPVKTHAEPAKTESAPVEAEIHEPVAPEPVDSEDLKPILQGDGGPPGVRRTGQGLQAVQGGPRDAPEGPRRCPDKFREGDGDQAYALSVLVSPGNSRQSMFRRLMPVISDTVSLARSGMLFVLLRCARNSWRPESVIVRRMAFAQSTLDRCPLSLPMRRFSDTGYGPSASILLS